MDYDQFPVAPLTKSILTALFGGLIATMVCLMYNLGYRSMTGYELNDLINVSSLIFVVNLLFLLVGIVHYLVTKYVKKGTILYIAIFAIITIFCIVKAAGTHRTPDHEETVEFRGLLEGVLVIMGITACIIVPMMYASKDFEKNVL